MEEFVRLIGVEISEGEMGGFKAGEVEVLVANIEGNLYAIGDRCTHRRCLLSKGKLEENVVICPCHRSRFDVKTGSVVSRPAKESEPIFEVIREGKDILIRPKMEYGAEKSTDE
jgi:nitrite reductase/ring-hydroxylating ferredoxin subunit